MPQMSQVLGELEADVLTAGISTRAVGHELNTHFTTISRLQCHFQEFGSTSDQCDNCRRHVTAPARDLNLHLQDCLRPATQTATATATVD